MAAVMRKKRSNQILKEPRAAMAPAAKRRESPGRKGVKTKPVSAKIMRKRRA